MEQEHLQHFVTIIDLLKHVIATKGGQADCPEKKVKTTWHDNFVGEDECQKNMAK